MHTGMVSKTDPDAPVVQQGRKESRPRYKNHRVVDDKHGVITAIETTPGDVGENAKLIDLVDQHEENTEETVGTVVADTQYGTVENFRNCNQRGIRSHMGDMQEAQKGKGRREGVFSEEDFVYDRDTDTYRCPVGQILTRRKHKKKRKAYEYSAGMTVCKVCQIRSQCTRAKGGAARTIKRHYDQQAIDAARKESHSTEAKKDRAKRKWFMEGSFADASNNHGCKRSRWRRLWRQEIQDYLIAAIQNVRILLRHLDKLPQGIEAQVVATKKEVVSALWKLFMVFQRFIPRARWPQNV